MRSTTVCLTGLTPYSCEHMLSSSVIPTKVSLYIVQRHTEKYPLFCIIATLYPTGFNPPPLRLGIPGTVSTYMAHVLCTA